MNNTWVRAVCPLSLSPSLKLNSLSVVATSRPPLVLITRSAPSVVTVPANATATVAIPRLAGRAIDGFREGDQPLNQARGVSIVSANDGAVTCEVVAGEYEFWYELR